MHHKEYVQSFQIQAWRVGELGVLPVECEPANQHFQSLGDLGWTQSGLCSVHHRSCCAHGAWRLQCDAAVTGGRARQQKCQRKCTPLLLSEHRIKSAEPARRGKPEVQHTAGVDECTVQRAPEHAPLSDAHALQLGQRPARGRAVGVVDKAHAAAGACGGVGVHAARQDGAARGEDAVAARGLGRAGGVGGVSRGHR
jgi:hypothetical protein